MIRTLLTAVVAGVATTVLGLLVVFAALLRIPNRPGGVYDWSARAWARYILAAAGVRVRLHGVHNIGDGAPRVFVANHVSWFDVFALASELPRYRFVAKAELFRIPIFGMGARAVGTVPIQRENRNSAFQSYETAGQMIREGNPVVVFPEGTRGSGYALRPFKKGPFVLAIAAGVPVVPTVVHGTRHILARGEFIVRPGIVDLHFLDPIPTAGLAYSDRDRLAADVHAPMAAAMQQHYGVESPPVVPRAGRRDQTVEPATELGTSHA